MLYTWIMDAKIPPEIAAFNGVDESICGGCKFRAQPKLDAGDIRPASTRMCYVRLSALSDEFGTPMADESMGPAEVWQAWKNGEFGVYNTLPSWEEDERRLSWHQYCGPLSVRIGSYGDPGAVPTAVWADLVRYAKNFTGYTHLWQTCDPNLKKYCMASVDTFEELIEADSEGWRCFIVVPADRVEWMNAYAKDSGDAVLCPMTAGKPVTCNTCHMCQGISTKVKPHIWEKAHGVNLANHAW